MLKDIKKQNWNQGQKRIRDQYWLLRLEKETLLWRSYGFKTPKITEKI